MGIESWKLAHSSQGGDETLDEELAEETRLEENFIPEQELHIDESLQPQYSEHAEFIPSQSSPREFNSLPEQEQQSGGMEIVQVQTDQEQSTDTKIVQEKQLADTKIFQEQQSIDTEMMQEQKSNDIEIVQGRVQQPEDMEK